MTLRELLTAVDGHGALVTAVFVALPVAALLVGLAHDREGSGQPPWKYVYAVLVYAAAVPGMCAVTLTAYALLFTGDNLLDVSLLVYALPVVSMIATLAIMGRNVDFDAVPGFDRLTALMVLLGLSFLVVFGLSRTRIWVLFGGSIWLLLGLLVAIYLGLSWAARALFAGRDTR